MCVVALPCIGRVVLACCGQSICCSAAPDRGRRWMIVRSLPPIGLGVSPASPIRRKVLALAEAQDRRRHEPNVIVMSRWG